MRTSSLFGGLTARSGLKPRDLAVDVALLELRLANGGIGAGDLLADRREGRAPFAERTRFAFFAEAGGRGLGKALGEFAASAAASIAPCRSARSSFSASMRLSIRTGRPAARARRPCVDRADRELGAAFALDPQRGRIQRQRKILRHQRGVAGGQVERDHAGDAGAVGIDGDGVDRRGDVESAASAGRQGPPGAPGWSSQDLMVVRMEFLPLVAPKQARKTAPISMRRGREGTGSIGVSVWRRRGKAAAGAGVRPNGQPDDHVGIAAISILISLRFGTSVSARYIRAPAA